MIMHTTAPPTALAVQVKVIAELSGVAGRGVGIVELSGVVKVPLEETAEAEWVDPDPADEWDAELAAALADAEVDAAVDDEGAGGSTALGITIPSGKLTAASYLTTCLVWRSTMLVQLIPSPKLTQASPILVVAQTLPFPAETLPPGLPQAVILFVANCPSAS